MHLRIGSRKSDLARLQAQHIGRLIQAAHPQVQITYDFSESLGDKNLEDPLWKAPEKGLFTSDLAQALENESVDLVVHSWKDMPIEENGKRMVMGTCRRADPRDLLLVKKTALSRISETRGIRIFSSSPRREYCLSQFLPELWPQGLDDVQVTSVRGNIPTRVRKLIESPEIDALVVAKAALDRLIASPEEEFKEVGLQLQKWIQQCRWMVLPLTTFPTAPAQGALAIEILSAREDLKKLLESVVDLTATQQVRQERAVLKAYGGGCHQKIGCTILNSKSGVAVRSLIGLTDQGEKLKSLAVQGFEKSEHPVWSTKPWDSSKVRRPILEAEKSLKSLADDATILISKAEALPSEFQTQDRQILWVAGLATWKKLAQKGYWIHGCSDGLGLQPPELEFLARRDGSCVLLTHAREDLPPLAIPTYSVDWSQLPSTPELGSDTAIYIRSRMDFEMARKLGLFDQPRRVYCGLGETFSFLQQFRSLFKELSAVHSEENL